MKLLGVRMLPKGAGEAEASAVFNLVQDWNISNKVKLMSFDTTASNADLKASACTLLEQSLSNTF
jgi:hypothetical protein